MISSGTHDRQYLWNKFTSEMTLLFSVLIMSYLVISNASESNSHSADLLTPDPYGHYFFMLLF